MLAISDAEAYYRRTFSLDRRLRATGSSTASSGSISDNVDINKETHKRRRTGNISKDLWKLWACGGLGGPASLHDHIGLDRAAFRSIHDVPASDRLDDIGICRVGRIAKR